MGMNFPGRLLLSDEYSLNKSSQSSARFLLSHSIKIAWVLSLLSSDGLPWMMVYEYRWNLGGFLLVDNFRSSRSMLDWRWLRLWNRGWEKRIHPASLVSRVGQVWAVMVTQLAIRALRMSRFKLPMETLVVSL